MRWGCGGVDSVRSVYLYLVDTIGQWEMSPFIHSTSFNRPPSVLPGKTKQFRRFDGQHSAGDHRRCGHVDEDGGRVAEHRNFGAQ